MSRSNLDRLNTYYRAELDSLRTAGRDFAQAYPNVASELSLSEGEARDPHVEHLVQSFAWMMGRLHMQMEAETRKVPSMLLEELAPNFIEARPPMSIVECEVDGAGTDFSSGFVLDEGLGLAPISMAVNEKFASRLSKVRFSTPYDVQLWPFRVAAIINNSEKELAELARHYKRLQSSIKITLEASDGASLDTLRFDAPVRFYMDLDQKYADRLYDLLASRVIGVAISDSSGRVRKLLGKDSFSMCGFDDAEQMFGLCSDGELGASVVEDFFAFPEKFSFFQITGLADLELSSFVSNGSAQINVHLILDDVVPSSIPLRRGALKLNCFPVINVFDKTTEPVVVNEKNYRYRLTADRSSERDMEIQKIVEVFGVDRSGVRHEIKPYFSTQQPDALSDGLYWVAQKEESQRRKAPGSDVWISVFSRGDVDLNGLSLYAHAKCNNRQLCEELEINHLLGVVGTAPVQNCRLLTRPTRYCVAELDEGAQWKMLAALSRHHVSLACPDTAKDALMMTLSLCAPADNEVAQRLLDSIESVTACEEPVASRQGGWRGYHHGTRYTIILNDRLFQGKALLFGRVVLHFLSLFSHVNSFSALDLYLGDRRVGQWSPITGHKTLA